MTTNQRVCFGLGMIALGVLMIVLLLLQGCVTLTQPRRAHQQLTVPDAPALAYHKAMRATLALGGQVLSQDPTQQAISARLNKAVVLNVALTPQGTGTVLDVQATAEAGYILEHDVPDDVKAFVAAYQKEPR